MSCTIHCMLFGTVKLRRMEEMGWAGHVAVMREKICVYIVLI